MPLSLPAPLLSSGNVSTAPTGGPDSSVAFNNVEHLVSRPAQNIFSDIAFHNVTCGPGWDSFADQTILIEDTNNANILHVSHK